MKKLHVQERAVEEVKLAIKPFYQKREVTKEEYKDTRNLLIGLRATHTQDDLTSPSLNASTKTLFPDMVLFWGDTSLVATIHPILCVSNNPHFRRLPQAHIDGHRQWPHVWSLEKMRPLESPGMDKGLASSGEGITGRRGAWSCLGFKKTALGWVVRCTVGAGSLIRA